MAEWDGPSAGDACCHRRLEASTSTQELPGYRQSVMVARVALLQCQTAFSALGGAMAPQMLSMFTAVIVFDVCELVLPTMTVDRP